jgi:hypothetical protein
MKVSNQTICFDSVPEMYDKESSGLKSNTVRYISEDEIIKQVESFSRIKITNTHTNRFFTRDISDVSTVLIKGTRIFIFSWR